MTGNFSSSYSFLSILVVESTVEAYMSQLHRNTCTPDPEAGLVCLVSLVCVNVTVICYSCHPGPPGWHQVSHTRSLSTLEGSCRSGTNNKRKVAYIFFYIMNSASSYLLYHENILLVISTNIFVKRLHPVHHSKFSRVHLPLPLPPLFSALALFLVA